MKISNFLTESQNSPSIFGVFCRQLNCVLTAVCEIRDSSVVSSVQKLTYQLFCRHKVR